MPRSLDLFVMMHKEHIAVVFARLEVDLARTLSWFASSYLRPERSIFEKNPTIPFSHLTSVAPETSPDRLDFCIESSYDVPRTTFEAR